MLVVVYVVSLIAFCIAAMIVPILFLPIVWAYKAISKEPVIPLTHPVALMPFIAATVVLLYATAFIWSRWGYSPAGSFPRSSR